MRIARIHSAGELADRIQSCGILPLFANGIDGWSVEEATPASYWFSEDRDGPWEWKGPAIVKTHCAYGKFFNGKTGFISRQWYPDFANWRRKGYDFDAAMDDGLVTLSESYVYETLQRSGYILSRDLKNLCRTREFSRSSYDAIIARLERKGYVITINFEYDMGSDGRPYGWGNARLATPEQYFGSRFREHVYDRTPEDSRRRLEALLKRKAGVIGDRQMKWILG